MTRRDPATASAGSATACMMDCQRLTSPLNEPAPELIEGRDGLAQQNQLKSQTALCVQILITGRPGYGFDRLSRRLYGGL